MDWSFYLNRWALPVIVTALFAWFTIYRKRVANWLVKREKRGQPISIRFITDGLRLPLADWRCTVLAPVLLAVGLELLVAALFNARLTSYGEPFWFAAVTSGFLNPVAEEVLARGCLIGFSLFFFHWLYLEKLGRTATWFYYATVLVGVSLVFTASHDNYSLIQVAARFSASMLYGALYLASGRNLLPAIAAHAASNWFLIFADAGLA
ncbi:MAG: CPBP family intramembrane glutamic endopeptidase [Candidatus Norongarragalinales archaeon]